MSITGIRGIEDEIKIMDDLMESIIIKSINKRNAPGGEKEFMITAELIAFPITSDGHTFKDADNVSLKKTETKYFNPETTVSEIFSEFKKTQDEWQAWFSKLMDFFGVVNWVNNITQENKK